MACPAAPAEVSGRQLVGATTPDCKNTATAITAIQPSGAIVAPAAVNNTDNANKTLKFYQGTKWGYQATATLAACTPTGATAALGASTTVFKQQCYNIMTSTPNAVRFDLVRQNTTDPNSVANQVVIAKPLTTLFGGRTCDASIKSVTTSGNTCTVEKVPVSQTGPSDYAISCSLTTAAGYNTTVTVTVAQTNSNPSYTSTFLVALPAGPPAPTPASDSSTTGVVLAVIGVVVLVGICGGVAWYVIKGRQDKDVDPYGDDATTGLTGNQDA